MRRLSGILLTGAALVLSLVAQPGPAHAAGQQATTPPPVTFTGDVVLWAFTVHANKTADYERALDKLREALQKIDRPEARRQAAGWKVIRNSQNQADGSALYIHVLNPVIPNADYSITNLVYEAFTDPAERLAWFEMYRDAIAGGLFTIQGRTVKDLSR